jgi:hypothetical protein
MGVLPISRICLSRRAESIIPGGRSMKSFTLPSWQEGPTSGADAFSVGGSSYRCGMSYRIAQLRALTDEQLVEQHDALSTNTGVGTGYFLEELDRRSRERSTEASNNLARESHALALRTLRLTWVSAGTSLAALVVAIVAIFLGR